LISSQGELAHWRAHNVGFVFQFYSLMPVLTAEGVELPLLLAKLSAAQRRKNAAVALRSWGWLTAPSTALEPAARSSASRSRGRWCRTRSCWCAMSRPVISTARPPMKS
jgi:ABC-type nitrate/sulfonate/bicarbonate transport system ATPase subunit